MKRFPLTQRMRDCLDFIVERYQADGISPSYREVQEHLGLKSVSGVHRIVSALIERGHLTMLGPTKARCLVPVEYAEFDPTTVKPYTPDRYWVGLDKSEMQKVLSAARVRRMTVNDFVLSAIKQAL